MSDFLRLPKLYFIPASVLGLYIKVRKCFFDSNFLLAAPLYEEYRVVSHFL